MGKTQYTKHPEYKIVRIDSFEQAAQYGRYNDWCLAQPNGKYNYDQYTSDGVNQLYFILRDGFEKEPRVKGENAPYDSYGLSMMTVIVDPEGMMTQSTTRWNHDNDSSDSAFTPKQISEIIGRNFYEVFKPNTKFKDAVANALEKLKMGARVEVIFDMVRGLSNGSFIVSLLGKQKAFKYQKWFDFVGNLREGFARVELNGKWAFINTNGELIGNGNLWFDNVGDFIEGFARVKLNGKDSFINTNGELIGNGNLWFDFLGCFDEGFAWVELNGKTSFINTKGELIGDGNLWFNYVSDFDEGFAAVKLNRKWSFINTKGELIGDGNLWFDDVWGFDEGFAMVILNGKYYYIKILSNNEVQFYDCKTKKPIPSPLTNQNESKKIIKLNAFQLQEIIKQCLTEIID